MIADASVIYRHRAPLRLERCAANDDLGCEPCSSSGSMRLAFRGCHFAPDVISLCLRWYGRYALSYRDLEETMAEGHVSVDHTT